MFIIHVSLDLPLKKNHKFDASQDVEADLGRKHIKKIKLIGK